MWQVSFIARLVQIDWLIDWLIVPAGGSVSVLDNNQLPNGQGGMQNASSSAEPNSPSRLRSVLAGFAAVLVCTLIGAIVVFGFDGTMLPFSTSLHAVPRLSCHLRRRMHGHPLRSAVGRSLSSWAATDSVCMLHNPGTYIVLYKLQRVYIDLCGLN